MFPNIASLNMPAVSSSESCLQCPVEQFFQNTAFLTRQIHLTALFQDNLGTLAPEMLNKFGF